MSTLAEEYSEAAGSLSAILKPLVNERVDNRMDAYVTKDHLDLKLSEIQIEMSKMESRLTMRLGGLIVIMVGIATGIIKLTPTTANPATPTPTVILVPSTLNTQAIQANPATPTPVLTVPAQ